MAKKSGELAGNHAGWYFGLAGLAVILAAPLMPLVWVGRWYWHWLHRPPTPPRARVKPGDSVIIAAASSVSTSGYDGCAATYVAKASTAGQVECHVVILRNSTKAITVHSVVPFPPHVQDGL